MSRPKQIAPRTERLNLCLTPEDRKALGLIAERERRDVGYVASSFVEWAIQQYLAVGANLVSLWEAQVIRDERIARNAKARLVLRQEAHRQHESVPNAGQERQRKRA